MISDSMAPLIEGGDLVLIDPYKPGLRPKLGDLILFKERTKEVLHRVVKKNNENVFLKGDNAFEFQKVSLDEIKGIGRVVFSGEKTIELASFKEKVFVILDKIFFQRIWLLKIFNYRVFRYKCTKKLKKVIW
jgi:signal peptidase I